MIVVTMVMAMLLVLKGDDGKEKIAMVMLMVLMMMMIGDGNANEVAYHSGAEAKYIFDLKQNLINFMHTRSYAALRAADLDWIVGPGYSLGSQTRGHN